MGGDVASQEEDSINEELKREVGTESSDTNPIAPQADVSGLPSDPAMIPSSEAWNGPKKLAKQAFPLLLLLALNLLYQYTIYIVLFIALALVFDRANDIVLRQIILQNRRSVKVLLLLFGFILVNIILAIPVIEKFWICNLLTMSTWFKTHTSFWNVLFDVAIMDFIIKFATVCVKCCIVLPTTTFLPSEKRGGVLVFTEGISQLIRCVMPTPEWIKYIITSSSCIAYAICLCVAILYAVFKVSAVKSKYNLLKNGWRLCCQSQIIGTPISDGDLAEISRKLCPICHKKYTEPMRIPCGHTFCHNCCQLWFDRDPFCPVCSSDSLYSLVMGKISKLPSSVQLTSRSSSWKTGTSEYIIQLF